MLIPDQTVSSFKGLNNFIKDLKTLTPGVASASTNWITSKFGDNIQLRRGTFLMGTRQTGAGKITGMGVGFQTGRLTASFFYSRQEGKILQ